MSAAVDTAPRHRGYGGGPDLDVGALVCGVWLGARPRGRTAGQAAELTRAAAAERLAGARVADMTRLPPPPRTLGAGYDNPTAWANREPAPWWPAAIEAMCARLEADFEAESAGAATRLLLVRNWPLTGTRDAPVAYLAACPVLGPLVAHDHRRVDDYVSWSGGDTAGPTYSAVLQAPAHLVAKIEKEQAALSPHDGFRFTAGPPATGGAGDLEAADDLLRTAFPVLPGDGDGEPPRPPGAVAAQRRARRAGRALHLDGDEKQLHHTAARPRDGHGSWVPDGPDDAEHLARIAPWLSWSTLRVDVLCGADGRADRRAGLFGTLESVTAAGIGLSPGGRHRPSTCPGTGSSPWPWLSEPRSAAQIPADEPGTLAPEQRRALEEIDPFWCPAWPITWQRAYVGARPWWLESDGGPTGRPSRWRPSFEGEQVGRFMVRVRAEWPALEEEQRDLLSAVGVEEDQELVAAKAAAEAEPTVSRTDRFAQGLAALAQFVERERHAIVRRPRKEPVEAVEASPGGEEQVVVSYFAPGTWLNNQKARRAKLTPGQLAQLAEHGVEWA
ncbi:helicase associated domain-containing protein [Kitasatospora sp. NPDC088346]|uniref:helicase associated domain-containing protein n=1 Tax=Kitasatospora sp. NPDC088346 TaxID=3364073 RepID=UPI003804219C